VGCDNVKLPGGGGAIVCTRARKRWCGWCRNEGIFLCDWKLGKAVTCDKAICSHHAEEVADEKHLCPEHQRAYQRWLTERARTATAVLR
jgi:hypothetical protein